MKILKTFLKTNIDIILNSEIINSDNTFYLKIDGYMVSDIRVLARITEISVKDKYRDLYVDDDTGKIIVRIWSEKYDMMKDLDVNDYIDVLGRIRFFKDIRYIDPFIIIKVNDMRMIRIRKKEIKLLKILLSKNML
ncbi:MAG: hypothetical protein DRJ34_01815 [Thermoprotei archaeon]|nr:MAG: hypothetical protein DRJ45_09365 [Thermoprotei archaeon]RLE69006.1 MAG: hypothetical protein DRJ34_01815 [Thermoprotei archaeon]